MTAGDAQTLVPRCNLRWQAWLFLTTMLACGIASAQTMYKYRGESGEWIFSDRPPDGRQDVETRSITSRATPGEFTVVHEFTGDGIEVTARNSFYAPMEVELIFNSIVGVNYPDPDQQLRWVIPARSDRVLLDLAALGGTSVPSLQYRYFYLPGDPDAEPSSDFVYRAPFSVGLQFPITQTYPDSITHRTRDSMYAVDISMPVGTDVVASRGGVVFDVAATNFKGGPNAERYADLANLVRILHDDGTYAVYAHLNWNTIRVQPGDRVEAGQYIADSGNTGLSSGPHLHFAVQRNMGRRIDSLPVAFRGADGSRVTPSSGGMLSAYP
jgi:murein DD-endopeptidase MepM/ murein hydrolase activator NlpD